MFPKVYQRPVAVPPDRAWPIVMEWLGFEKAKVLVDDRPRSVKAQLGKSLRIATQKSARKIPIVQVYPIPEGSMVTVTMELYWGYRDDATLLEPQIDIAWQRFLQSLWVRFGYPPTMPY